MKATKKKTTVEQMGGEEKKKALQAAISQIEKDFGKGTIMRLGENARMNVEAVPTGSLPRSWPESPKPSGSGPSRA